MHRSRRSPLAATGVAASALAVLLLTAACSSAPRDVGASASAGPSAAPSASASTPPPLTCPSAGPASDAVKVTAKGARAEPGVAFPTPTTVTTTQTTVVTPGTGAALQPGATVQVAFVIYNAKTGKRVDAQGYGDKGPFTLQIDQSKFLPGLVQALDCSKEGERLAAVIPASQAFGDQGAAQLGIGAGDSLVLVADVLGAVPTKASGAKRSLPSGFPTVTLAANGQPTVRIPATEPPKSLRIATLQQGKGETVRDGDTVTVQYQGVNWRTGKVFDQSWTKGGPTAFATNAVVKGFAKALVGAKTGSQVVAIIPPADGYGANGSPDAGIRGTDTLVFVVDVLATGRS